MENKVKIWRKHIICSQRDILIDVNTKKQTQLRKLRKLRKNANAIVLFEKQKKKKDCSVWNQELR